MTDSEIASDDIGLVFIYQENDCIVIPKESSTEESLAPYGGQDFSVEDSFEMTFKDVLLAGAFDEVISYLILK